VKEKAARAAELLFYAGILCELIVSPSGYLFGGYREPVIIVTGMAFFSLSLLLTVIAGFHERKKELPFYALLCGYALVCYYFQHSALVLRIVLILLSGRDRKLRDVVRMFLFGTLAIVLFGAVLSLLGLHNPPVMTDHFRHEEEKRLALGFFHPNGFAFFIFRIYVMWIWLYGEKAKLRSMIPVILGTGVLLVLARSKAALFIFVLLTAGMIVFRKSRSKLPEKLLYFAGLTAGVVICALMLALRFFPFPQQNYGNASTLWDYMNEFTTGRMQHAMDALRSTPVSLFGCRDVPDGTEIGFVNAFLNQGAVFVLLFAVVFFVCYRRLYRTGERYGMLLALSFLLYSMAEAYLPYFNKNGIWMLMIGWGAFWKVSSGKGKEDEGKR